MDKSYLPSPRWAKILVAAAYAVIALGGAFLCVKALPAFLPFLLSGSVAALLRRPASALARKTRLPFRAVAAALCALFVAAVCALTLLLAGRLVPAAGYAAKALARAASDAAGAIASLREKLRGAAGLASALDALIGGVAQMISDAAGSVAGALMSLTPAAVLFAAVSVVSLFCFTCGAGIPPRLRKSAAWRTAKKLRRVAAAYLKSAAFCSLCSFGVLSLGLVVMRCTSPFLLAALCALLDFLPVFGVGTVLLPWAAVSLAVGEGGKAAALLILYAVCTLIRHVAEPRFLSGAAGAPAVLSLAATYAGLRLFGIWGMLALPAAAVILWPLFAGRVKDAVESEK